LDDPLESRVTILQVELETQVCRQFKPKRHFLLFPDRGELFGQRNQDLLLEAEFKEFLLVGLADDLDLIKLPAAKGLQDPLLVMLDDF
jgi:hypothetical protein